MGLPSLCLRLVLLCAVAYAAVSPSGCLQVDSASPQPAARRLQHHRGRMIGSLERSLYHLLLATPEDRSTAAADAPADPAAEPAETPAETARTAEAKPPVRSRVLRQRGSPSSESGSMADRLRAVLGSEEPGEDLVRIRFG